MRKDREKGKEEREKQKRGKGVQELPRLLPLQVGPVDDDGDARTLQPCL
jgi:hypothetical protein